MAITACILYTQLVHECSSPLKRSWKKATAPHSNASKLNAVFAFRTLHSHCVCVCERVSVCVELYAQWKIVLLSFSSGCHLNGYNSWEIFDVHQSVQTHSDHFHSLDVSKSTLQWLSYIQRIMNLLRNMRYTYIPIMLKEFTEMRARATTRPICYGKTDALKCRRKRNRMKAMPTELELKQVSGTILRGRFDYSQIAPFTAFLYWNAST